MSVSFFGLQPPLYLSLASSERRLFFLEMRVAFLSHAACVSTCECAWMFVQICASSQSPSFLLPILSVLSHNALKLPFKRKRILFIYLFIYIGMHTHIREFMFCTWRLWEVKCHYGMALCFQWPHLGWVGGCLVMSCVCCLTLFLPFQVNMIILFLSTPWGQSIRHSFVQFLSILSFESNHLQPHLLL